MSNRLYVGNLSFHTTQESLHQAFAACGDVAAVDVVLDRDTGRSRGFAFVEMATPAGAQKAIAEMNGTNFEGRSLRVDVAEERRGGRGGGGGGGGGGGFGGGGPRRGR